MSKHKLETLVVGDAIRFPGDSDDYIVKHVGIRYTFACTEDGCHYTVIDKVDKVLASTTMTFETFANFYEEGYAETLEKLLTTGERELSRKYRDTFQQFNIYKGKVIKKNNINGGN